MFMYYKTYERRRTKKIDKLVFNQNKFSDKEVELIELLYYRMVMKKTIDLQTGICNVK